MPMNRNINLISQRALDRKERLLQRREQFLGNMPVELAKREFTMKPTPARERIKVNHTPDGYTYAEYKSSVTLDVVGGPDLPMEFQMTEIVLSGGRIKDDD